LHLAIAISASLESGQQIANVHRVTEKCEKVRIWCNDVKCEQVRSSQGEDVRSGGELRDYLEGFTYDHERGMELTAAVNLARDEFVDQLESLCPPFPD
jgi:hypothetical protein